LDGVVKSTAIAGTIVTPKQALPKLQAIPNSVIFTPCLIKERTVVASSGTKLPIATTIPVISQLKPYLFDILRRAGNKNLSDIKARLRRMYIAKRTSR